MNFPLEYPIFQFFYWLVNTAGIGGIFVILVGAGSMFAYFLTLRWIIEEGDIEEQETYSFPTSALHHYYKDDKFSYKSFLSIWKQLS